MNEKLKIGDVLKLNFIGQYSNSNNKIEFHDDWVVVQVNDSYEHIRLERDRWDTKLTHIHNYWFRNIKKMYQCVVISHDYLNSFLNSNSKELPQALLISHTSEIFDGDNPEWFKPKHLSKVRYIKV